MKRSLVSMVVLGVAGLLALGACSGDPDPAPSTSTRAVSSSEPTPTPTPTQKTPEELAAETKQANIDAAKQTLIDYYAKASEIGANHLRGWEELQIYWGSPEVTMAQSQTYTDGMESGMYTEGATRAASVKVTEYIEDPTVAGMEQVSFNVCFDASKVRYFNADGTEIDQSQHHPKNLIDYTLQRQGIETPWAIIFEDQHLDQPC